MPPLRERSGRSSFAKPAGATIAAVLLLAGCKTSTYVLQVDAISQAPQVAQTGEAAPKGKEPKSFKVRAHNPKVDEDSLRYHEVSDYVKTALSAKGMYEAPTAETADLIIEIDYGMETPRMKYETVSTPIIVFQEGLPTRELVPMGTSASGQVIYKTVRIPGPQVRKIVGWREETEPVVVYEKYLKVSARQNQESVEGRPPPEVWSVNVSAEDESQELRKYLPIMASATADYIGTNTKREKSVAVHEGDENVEFIKKGM
ncbi:MAG TPA: hypothetical protein VG734_04525 [Lacunisphaera sp.]|nr:hypothetical protein [Lacunisphaera sp.]